MTSSRDSRQGGDADPVMRVLRRSSGRLRLTVNQAADPIELEHVVRATAGVKAASVSVKTGNLLVTFDPGRTDEQTVLATIRSAVDPAPATAAGDHGAGPGQNGIDVLVHDVAPADGWMAAEGSCVVRAAPRDCARAILDFNAYPEWQRYVTRVEVLEHDRRGRASVVRTEGRVGEHAVVHVMRYSYPSSTRILWEQLEGELEAIRGAWRFVSVGRARTRAIYRLEIRPGLRLRLLLRGSVYAQGRDMLLAHTLGELRSRAEAASASPRP